MILSPATLGRGGSVPPSERLTFDVIGLGSRSLEVLMPRFFAQPGARILAGCD